MFLVSVFSAVAIAFGIGANLPQISRMLRTRSAAGQSPVGWMMGAITNLCMAYVNLVGLGATFLGVANLGTVVLCSIAISLTLRYGASHGQPAVVAATPAHDTMVAMPTQEFALLHEAVTAAEQRRAEWRARQLEDEQQAPAAPVLAGVAA